MTKIGIALAKCVGPQLKERIAELGKPKKERDLECWRQIFQKEKPGSQRLSEGERMDWE